LMFLIAAIFTVTGALSQFELLRLMMGDLSTAGVLSQPTADRLRDLWRALQVATLIYAGVSLVQAVRTQKEGGKALRDMMTISENDLPPATLL
jgi:hypothetical protein